MTKSAFITIVGRPNVGKSSLLNRLIGQKVAIVSDKPQTTRTKITGILTQDEIQYVFMDTPGFHKIRTKLSGHMCKAVGESLSGMDLALLVADAGFPPGELEQELIENLKARRLKTVLVLNKIDKISEKNKLIEVIDKYSLLMDFEQIIPVSVLEDDGIDRLFSYLESVAKPSPHFFESDDLTDQPEKTITAELIREQILNTMREEIPHGTAVVIEKMKEREGGKEILDIDAEIFCERKSHKGMIIGKNGENLKRIASAARENIESFMGCKVFLQCWVKVKEDWRNKEEIIKNLGLN